MKVFNEEKLNQALSLLESRIRAVQGNPVRIVVCGGSALIYTKLVSRTTKDVDILAIIEPASGMKDPDPLPAFLTEAARVVAATLNLPEDWLNTGPADLLRMGLPGGFEDRLVSKRFGTHLTVYFIGRLDQIHFKLYAAVDRGGYHIDDLLALNPSGEELIMAARWSMTHDVSEGYAMLLKKLLKQLGYENEASKI